MNIAATNYSLSLRSFDIFISGCNPPHCAGCHNPQLHDFCIGETYTRNYYETQIKNKVLEFNFLIDNIMIFGGEPLDQPYFELEQMLHHFKELNKKIWLFTRYDMDVIPERILDKVDYVKSGRYMKNLTTNNNIQFGINLASSNQMIYDISNFNVGENYEYRFNQIKML